MQNPDALENWLKAINKNDREREIFLEFSSLCQKTPDQIIAEFEPKAKKEFQNHYGDLLLKYVDMQQKKLPSNLVRDQVNVIRSFFSYYNLPIKFGFKAHIQFFFK
jgi:hypothetical protein